MSLGFNNAVRFGDVQRALSVTPTERLAWPGYPERDSMVTYVEIPGRHVASTHRVRVAKGLRDEFKQTLARDFVSEVRFEQPFPRVGIGISDGTLASADRAPIPIAAINVKQGSVIAAALSRADVKALLANGESDALHGLVLRHPGARRQSLAKPPSSTAIVQSSIDPFGLLSAGGLGVLAIAADYVKDQRDSDPPANARLAKVSDLGISAKVSPEGSLVWVTRLSTAEPVARAEIEIGGGKRRYLTNDQGLALIPSADFRPDFGYDSQDLVFASAGNDWTFEALRDALPAWQLPVSTSIGAELGLAGLLFTERGVYRPGDTVRVKGVVRRETTHGSAAPQGRKANADTQLAGRRKGAHAEFADLRFRHLPRRSATAGRCGARQLPAPGLARKTVDRKQRRGARV